MKMNKSDSIANLASALSNLQSHIDDAYKSRQGYGYKYADIESVLNVVRPHLKENGLSIMPMPGKIEYINDNIPLVSIDERIKTVKELIELTNKCTNEKEYRLLKELKDDYINLYPSIKIDITTILMHNSGEWISSDTSIISEYKKGMSSAQSIGSALTYARRYALASFLGIAQSDDDATLKSMPEPSGKISSENVSYLESLPALLNDPEKKEKMLKHFNIEKISDMNSNQYNTALKFLT
jgi:hypothetical protein